MTQDQLTYQGTLTVMRCWCGLRHAIPSELEAEQQRTGMALHCPLGHTYIPANRAENTRLRAQLQQARAAAAATAELLQFEQRSHAATKGHLTRTRRRIKAGVCPCCNRTFQDLARHMAAKHPDKA